MGESLEWPRIHREPGAEARMNAALRRTAASNATYLDAEIAAGRPTFRCAGRSVASAIASALRRCGL